MRTEMRTMQAWRSVALVAAVLITGDRLGGGGPGRG